MAMSPGTYLRKRREAAGLSLDDVAARIACEPRYPEHERRHHLALLEADTQPAGATTIAMLRRAFAFDGEVLDRLSDLFYFNAALPEPRICRACGCSERDACVEHGLAGPIGCAWVEEDLCSACPADTQRAEPHPAIPTSSTGEAR